MTIRVPRRLQVEGWSRREALRLLGFAGLAGGSLVTACGGGTPEPTDQTEPGSSLDDRANASVFPDGSIVRTILEDVSPDRLTHGAVLFHEHMSLSVPAFWDRLMGDAPSEAREERIGSPDAPFFMEDVDAMVAELQAASREGVSALVDGGHADMGRSVAFLREISEKSGMPIVASGGYYIDPFHPPELENQTEDDIAAALADAATAERWGTFGEIASSAEITPSERKVLRAVGKAHLATQLAIFTHTANGLEAVEQVDILESLGVPLDRVAIGHLGSLDDPDVTVHKAVAARGAFLGFDRVGYVGGGGQAAQWRGPEADARKVSMVLALLEAGFLHQVLLASDFHSARDTQRNGGPGYAQTVTRFVPMLREAGVTEDQIRTMTTDNPLRFIAFTP